MERICRRPSSPEAPIYLPERGGGTPCDAEDVTCVPKDVAALIACFAGTKIIAREGGGLNLLFCW